MKGIFRLLIRYSNIVNGIAKNKAKHSEYLLILKKVWDKSEQNTFHADSLTEKIGVA